MRKLVCMLWVLLFMMPLGLAEDESAVYEMQDENGQVIMRLAGRIYPGDEYISGENLLYVVTRVNDRARIALAECRGEEVSDRAAMAEAKKRTEDAEGSKKGEGSAAPLVCLYHTHSDESYIEGDGTESLMEDAGIYDIGDALAEALTERGLRVEHSEETFHPHDTKAYERSRRTAEEMVKMGPAAIFDVHRDGIPDEAEYETEVEGEDTSMVRLLVGRSNQNAQANRAFAKELKAAADARYPGLIKDIFIGKGNYNQELYAHSVLLEFGTHTIDKEKALSATEYMADVIAQVLGGDTARADAPNRDDGNTEKEKETSSAFRGIVWVLIAGVIALALYTLISSGGLAKMKRTLDEMAGGMGKRKK